MRLTDGALKLDFISECCSKCDCYDSKCGNMILQNDTIKRWNLSIEKKLQLKTWCLYSKEELIPKGSFIFELVGEIISDTTMEER